MQGQNVRVVIASEYPKAWNFFSGIIEQGGKVDIVGQARDASKAVTLVKNLRPDVAIIDGHLPHAAGMDTMPMTRMSGLDTAQAILTEMPAMKVILLNNLDTKIRRPDRDSSPDSTGAYSIKSMGRNISFVPQDDGSGVETTNDIVFASVEANQEEAEGQQAGRLTDKIIFFGSLAFAAGWFLILTMFLAPVGIALALAGGATVIFGLAGKLGVSFCYKIKRGILRG